MQTPTTINTSISEQSIDTQVSADLVQTGQTADGARVEVPVNAKSTLDGGVDADAMEEISVRLNEDREKEVKKERVHQGHKKTVIIANVTQVQKFMEHMRRNYTMQQLAALAKRILNQANSAGQMLSLVQQEFDDPPSQYMLLQFIGRYGEERNVSQDKLEMVNEALARLEEDHGDVIFAGINAAQEGSAYGQTTEQVKQFVSAYKDTVLNSKTLTDILGNVLSLLKPEGAVLQEHENEGIATAESTYPEVIAHLIKALGNDMDAIRPSRDPQKLQAVLSDLYRLQVLNSLLENCHQFSQGMHRYFAVDSIVPSKLMQDLVAISADTWVGAGRFTNMPPQYDVRPVTLKVLFTKGVINILKEIPVQIFDSLETRNNMIGAAKEALEALIVEEEEGVEEEGGEWP